MSDQACRDKAGSYQGFVRHMNRKQSPCGPCAKAYAVRSRELREYAKAAAVADVLRRHPELHMSRWLPGVDVLHAITENA